MSDETYNDLMEFVEHVEIEVIEELTGFGEDEILSDFLLYCNLAELEVNRETWLIYIDETKDQY